MNNYLLWAQLITSLATSVAQSRGANTDAIAYLSLLTVGLRAGRLTDEQLQHLQKNVQEAIIENRPVTHEQLSQIDEAIRQASETIQLQQPQVPR